MYCIDAIQSAIFYAAQRLRRTGRAFWKTRGANVGQNAFPASHISGYFVQKKRTKRAKVRRKQKQGNLMRVIHQNYPVIVLDALVITTKANVILFDSAVILFADYFAL